MSQSDRNYLRRSLHWLLLGGVLASVLPGLTGATELTGAEMPTLEELKASGAQQSRYRNRQANVAPETPQISPEEFGNKIMPILAKH